MPKLTLDDIDDLRAYERTREELLAGVIALKKKRRVTVGERLTLVFENAVTIRFQIQEMARIEKMIRDEEIEGELAVYNPLIPDPGHLAATMFIELTSDAELREWLPKLVGIETEVEFRVGGGAGGAAQAVRCVVDPDHARFLTREDTTAAVHYVHFSFTPEQVEAFAAGPVVLAVTHPNYSAEAQLGPDTVASLLDDLRNGG